MTHLIFTAASEWGLRLSWIYWWEERQTEANSQAAQALWDCRVTLPGLAGLSGWCLQLRSTSHAQPLRMYVPDRGQMQGVVWCVCWSVYAKSVVRKEQAKIKRPPWRQNLEIGNNFILCTVGNPWKRRPPILEKNSYNIKVRIYLFMCLYMVYTAYTHLMYVYMCEAACAEPHEDALCPALSVPTLFPWSRISHWTWSWTDSQQGLSNPPVSTSPALRLQLFLWPCPDFFCRC